MKRSTRIILLSIATALAFLRCGGETGEVFQAAAHFYMGFLCTRWWDRRFASDDAFYGTVVVALSTIEVICFVASGGHFQP